MSLMPARPRFNSGLSKAIFIALIAIGTHAHAAGLATDVLGAWKLVSRTVTMGGRTVDSHEALLRQRPCVAKVRHTINADGTYRLDLAASGCDADYSAAQEKLYARMKWKVDGSTITTSSTNFAVGQTYTVTVSGNRMTWVGTDGQGTLVFER